MNLPFTGCATALITPMKWGGIDLGALSALIERQISAGIGALVPCGTTGEASTLSGEEKLRVISHTVKCAKGRVPVIAGCSSTSTKRLAELAREAQKAGADALLCLSPYYNKASKEGVYLHYKYVCERVDIPVIAYNVPQRTGLSIDIETYKRLSALKNFAGVKEASGNVSYCSKVLSRFGTQFPLYSGCDELTAPLYALGASGVISVASNAVPEMMVRLCSLCEKGDMKGAAECQISLAPFIEALFSEINPIPIKTALAMMGMCTEEMRLPLCPLKSEQREALLGEMNGLGISVSKNTEKM